MTKVKEFWQRGQRAALARATGLTAVEMSDILHRRRSIGKDRALSLATASEEILGEAIPLEAWLWSTTTDHPAFFNDPLEGEEG